MLAGLSVKEPLPWLYWVFRANKAKACQVFVNDWPTLFNVDGEKTNTGGSVDQVVFLILLKLVFLSRDKLLQNFLFKFCWDEVAPSDLYKSEFLTLSECLTRSKLRNAELKSLNIWEKACGSRSRSCPPVAGLLAWVCRSTCAGKSACRSRPFFSRRQQE